MKIDKNIKEKLQNRAFEPSTSAWERLSVKLDEQPKQKKRGWFFYIGAAASILLLITIGNQLLFNSNEEITPKNEVVIEKIDKDLIDKKLEKLNNEIPVEEAIVWNVKGKKSIKNNIIISTKEKSFNKRTIANNVVIPTKEEPISLKITSNDVITSVHVNEKVIPDVEVTNEKHQQENKIKILKQDPNSRIKINSDDLLYVVTHTKEEVKTYYAKYNIDRVDVLKSIQKQLKMSNLKIDANTILAEVEKDIDEDDFQNNFMKSLKKRVRNIATAIASRNN